MLKQFLHQLTNIEKGFLHTAIILFSDPETIIHNFWNRNIVKYYNPFRYLLIWTAINLAINFWIGLDDLLQEYLQPKIVEDQFGADRIAAADQKFDNWLNALVLLLLPFLSYLTTKFFSYSKRNYAEHLILNAFIMGQHALIASFTQFIFYGFPALISGYLVFNFLIGILFNTYVFRRVFQEGLLSTLFKTLGIGILGLLLLFVLITLASSVAILIV